MCDCLPLPTGGKLSRNDSRLATMADLTIRNLTITELELKLVERFDAQPVESGGVANITSKLSGLFNSTSAPVSRPAVPQGEGRDRRDVSIVVPRFETRLTDVRSPDPAREVVRLTFEHEEGQRYRLDIPGASARSIELERLDGAPKEYTAVYVQNGCTLAIFSSANLASWMRELKDDFPLSALSIPGTHNSPTCHVALPSVRCQAAGVREQLDNGVRFFDIRVSVSEDHDNLSLVHSAFPISLTGTKYFRELLDEVYAFLDANPSETLVMSVKREGTGKGSDQRLSRILKDKFYEGNKERWFTRPWVPRLREARGKIVLLRRHVLDDSLRGEHDGKGWGLDGSAWPDNCEDGRVGSGIARVQDFYEVGESTNIGKKIELARKHLERAGEKVGFPEREKEPEPFFINFLSASNFFNASCWPEKVAAKANPAIIEYLCVRHGEDGKGPDGLKVGDAATGIVVTDWVGQDGDWDLIRCIVGWNARLQMKE
ncbi:phosphatidylinositol-specific phospholipase C [Microdochium trichocladiopsis]|uniref:Phosphatidylinositol-specific phospholipase C n=1 Tax=Microdochium trichocladiopsis TaxID=1682393 RepID=A0A9P9BUD1_9PEZI|nr:phosphatidylinositol-specific phospholipase C [Microdochium trichocladiopsis]KAH7031339.1 phosphatidylinositol-specific phospholipase C [Microdochium trichocladiopsis]